MTATDDMQHHFNCRGGATGCQALVRDGETIIAAVHLGEAGGKILQILPVGGGGMPLQQACLGHQPGTAVNAGNGGALGRNAAQAGEQAGGGLPGQLEAGHDNQQLAVFQPGQRKAGHMQATGQHWLFLCGADIVPVKDAAPGQPVGGAHRINGGRKRERVAFIKHQHRCFQRAMFGLQDVFCGFHQLRFA
jgi:hypothetical protein